MAEMDDPESKVDLAGEDVDSSFEEEVVEAVFNEAANEVQAYATGLKKVAVKPSDAQMLELYGLYKRATSGPCNEPQPGIFSVRARSKWNAWKDRSSLSKLEAMSQYVHHVMGLYSWEPPAPEVLFAGGQVTKPASGGFAPAVSRPRAEPEEDSPDKDTPFGWVKDNDIRKISSWLKTNPSDVNLRDTEGLSLLHWAADRGNVAIVKLLLAAGASGTVTDDDDQTPLDYAITCEHLDVISLLQSKSQSVT